jgi:hypothetical protein
VSGERSGPTGITFLEAASRQLFGTSMGRANDDPRLTTHADILRCYDAAIGIAGAAARPGAKSTES